MQVEYVYAGLLAAPVCGVCEFYACILAKFLPEYSHECDRVQPYSFKI